VPSIGSTMKRACARQNRLGALWAVFAVCFFMATGAGGEVRDARMDRRCLSCHARIESMGPDHDFECGVCHLQPAHRSLSWLDGHRKVVRNPSDPRWVRTFCMPCHEQEIGIVEKGLHGTVAGIINQTRYLWGAQEKASPPRYGLSGPLAPLPEPDPMAYPENPAQLVDDFLRRRCLRCHIHTEGSTGDGLYRASGCAACHVPYEDDGRYRGSDTAVDREKAGYPARHVFRSPIPNDQCLRCHNQNHVGADYMGLFQHDFSERYRSPVGASGTSKRIYGLDYHHLAVDIHAERGLWCVDCHRKADVMGDGKVYGYQMAVPKTSCSGCHGGFRGARPDPSIPGVVAGGSEFRFRTRGAKRLHRLPLFDADVVAHGVMEHERVRCSACHAQWSFQDYGLSVIREDRLDPLKWLGLEAQGDPVVEKVLLEVSRMRQPLQPATRDRVSWTLKKGAWSLGWRYRRWELMPLGVDHEGRFSIVRPLYQFIVSYVDEAGYAALDGIIPIRGDFTSKGWAFSPYVPHTVSPAGRSCMSCHLSRSAAGLGWMDGTTPDLDLTRPAPPAVPGMRLLSGRERQRLLNPSKRWRKLRFRALRNTRDVPMGDAG